MVAFWEGVLAGYGIAIPVGAIAILIVTMAMRCGFKIGFMAGAGAATADLLYATVASIAGATLVTVLGPVASWLQLVSAVVLLGLAAYGLWGGFKYSKDDGRTARECGPWMMFGQFLAITIINPLTVVYFTALILGRDSSASPSLLEHILFILGAGLASLSWQTLLAWIGGVARGHLSKHFQLGAIIFGNLLIICLAVRIIMRAH